MTHVNCNKLYAHTYTNGITPRKNTKKATERVRKKKSKDNNKDKSRNQ
jgi:hypothetical protein